jgi:negative regulator of flagellin synthesis FlgM
VSNKINDLSTGATGAGTTSQVSKARGSSTGTPNAAPAAGSGDVHITDTATHLAALEQALRDTPVVDQARVARLRAAIEQGQYTIHPALIASRFLHIEHALAGLSAESPAASAPAEGQ